MQEKFKNILQELHNLDNREYDYFHSTPRLIPSRKEIIHILKNIQCIMFPDYFHLDENAGKSSMQVLSEIYYRLCTQIKAAFAFCSECDDSDKDPEGLAGEIISLIPRIKEMLIKDVQAIYEGDPAARAPEEVTFISGILRYNDLPSGARILYKKDSVYRAPYDGVCPRKNGYRYPRGRNHR